MLPIIFLFCSYSLFGAFSSTTAWDVRTTGNAANGGGFNTAASGTDRSQQDAAFIAYTDIIVGGTTTQGTSVLNPFDATSPGNIVNIASGAGCTVQRAQVVSVAGSTATFDKSLGTAASVCAGNYGGGLASIQAAVSLAASLNSVHIKSGTYTVTAFVTVGSGIWLHFIGYGTTHNDGGTRPLITTSTNSVNLFEIPASTNANFTNIRFTNTAGTRFAAITLTGGVSLLMVNNCIFDGMGNGVYAPLSDRPIYIINSEVKNSTGGALYSFGGSFTLYGSYIHDNTAYGVRSDATSALFVTMQITRSIITGNTDGVVASTDASIIVDESVIANNSGDGLDLTAPRTVVINNSIIYSNNGYGINASAAPFQLSQYNNGFGDNTSGNRNNVAISTSDIAITADPFTNSAAGNYGLNSTAGGGAVLKATGFPGAFPGGTTTGFLDVGAVQTVGGSAPATIAYPSVQ